MRTLHHRVRTHIRRLGLLKPGDRLGVAVSGGADSVALLRILLELGAELGIVLSIVHFNHMLRGAESDEDEHFVSDLAQSFQLDFHRASGDTAAEAAANDLSVEAAAREMRYAFFQELLQSESEARPPLDKIATGHTLDDQAETVLMRMIRGTGMRGLGGIHPIIEFQEGGDVIRPLLEVRHHELEHFLKGINQRWREDSSNRDSKFTRNRVRHVLAPLLEQEFNPSFAENLSELAEIVRGEEDYWQNEVAGWMGTAIHWVEPEWARKGQQGLVQLQPFNPELQRRLGEQGPLVMNAIVDLVWVLSEPLAVQRRALKAVGDLAGFPLEFKHVDEILRFAADETNDSKHLSLPLGWRVLREPTALTFLTPDLRVEPRVSTDYEYPLPLPGRAIVPEAGIVVEALPLPASARSTEYNSDHLLDPFLLSKELKVRNWRPGDRFCPAHTKAPKKIKELLQERHVSGEARKVWPVVAHGNQIVWVRGFPVPAALQAKESGEAIFIRDRALEDIAGE